MTGRCLVLSVWSGTRREGLRLQPPSSDLRFGSGLSPQSIHLPHPLPAQLNLCSLSRHLPTPRSSPASPGGEWGTGGFQGTKGSCSPSLAWALVPRESPGQKGRLPLTPSLHPCQSFLLLSDLAFPFPLSLLCQSFHNCKHSRAPITLSDKSTHHRVQLFTS